MTVTENNWPRTTHSSRETRQGRAAVTQTLSREITAVIKAHRNTLGFLQEFFRNNLHIRFVYFIIACPPSTLLFYLCPSSCRKPKERKRNWSNNFISSSTSLQRLAGTLAFLTLSFRRINPRKLCVSLTWDHSGHREAESYTEDSWWLIPPAVMPSRSHKPVSFIYVYFLIISKF